MIRIRRLLTASATATAVALLALGGATAVRAETAPIENAGSGTFNSTSELGTGAMTSNASVSGLGGADAEHRDAIVRDNFGRVGGGLSIEGGATYRVTVTLQNAFAEEAATSGATARGFVSVDLYDCCFAGEASFVGGGQAELPSDPGTVTVELDVFLGHDSLLTADVKLHSYVSAFVDSDDSASVEASNDITTIDISLVGEPAPEPTTPVTTEVPAVTLPDLTLPELTLPELTLPELTLPPVSTSAPTTTQPPATTSPATTQPPRICVLGICL